MLGNLEGHSNELLSSFVCYKRKMAYREHIDTLHVVDHGAYAAVIHAQQSLKLALDLFRSQFLITNAVEKQLILGRCFLHAASLVAAGEVAGEECKVGIAAGTVADHVQNLIGLASDLLKTHAFPPSKHHIQT